MEKERKQRSIELITKMKETIKDQVEKYKGDISDTREKIEKAKKRQAFKIHLARQVGGVLERVSDALIKDVRVYWDEICIECVNEAASSTVAHLITQFTDFSRLHKEMTGRTDRIDWFYQGEVAAPGEDIDRWYTEKFSIRISPSYSNPECVPIRREQSSTYTSWECIKSV